MLGLRDLSGLGDEFLSMEVQKQDKKTSINSICLAHAIPRHNNLPFVDEIYS